ncbi:MAG: hypothetical protein R3C49_19650 [Planctomycetaceae bacterium]
MSCLGSCSDSTAKIAVSRFMEMCSEIRTRRAAAVWAMLAIMVSAMLFKFEGYEAVAESGQGIQQTFMKEREGVTDS